MTRGKIQWELALCTAPFSERTLVAYPKQAIFPDPHILFISFVVFWWVFVCVCVHVFVGTLSWSCEFDIFFLYSSPR